jgi:hypothetical protein
MAAGTALGQRTQMTAVYLHSTSPRWFQTVRTGTAGHAQVPIGQILEPSAPGRAGTSHATDRHEIRIVEACRAHRIDMR